MIFWRELAEAASRCGEAAGSLLIVSRTEPDGLRRDDGHRWLANVAGPGDLPADRLFDLGLIHDALEHIDAGKAVQVLARLRDQVCREVVLELEHSDATPGAGDLLALGFERLEPRPGAATLYRYDVDSYNPAREWNTAEDWANPENFDRYRW